MRGLMSEQPLLISMQIQHAANFPGDCRIILLGEGEAGFPVLARYDELVAAENADFAWPVFDEWTASALCYTSGTTGKPKGALYSHRATVLHAWALASPDATAMSARDTVCPVGRLGGAAGPDRRVRKPTRHRGHPGLGHDRDEPARHCRRAEGEASRRRARDDHGNQGQGRAAGVRGRDEDRRRSGTTPAA